MSNLTQLIDLTVYKIHTKICALISLNNDANLNKLLSALEKVIKEKEKYTYLSTFLIPNKLYKSKDIITFIKTIRNIYSILDACKVTDIFLFVSSCKNCRLEKWQLDPDKYSNMYLVRK